MPVRRLEVIIVEAVSAGNGLILRTVGRVIEVESYPDTAESGETYDAEMELVRC